MEVCKSSVVQINSEVMLKGVEKAHQYNLNTCETLIWVLCQKIF